MDAGLLSDSVLLFVLPDQEQLQRIDEDEKDIVKNKRQFLDGDCPHKKAGTGDQNQDEHRGGQVASFLCSYRLDELGESNEHPRRRANPA